MKAKSKKVKSFDTVKTFRKIKDNISKEIAGMSYEQLQVWLKNNKLKAQS